MTYLEQLPPDVAGLIQTRFLTEYASVSRAEVPIDTPLLVFTSADLKTLDVATGLADPAKAERARRNPKVGLLLEGRPEEPVVSIAGFAAVRDADLQANLDRYLSESIAQPPLDPEIMDWNITRRAIWYLTRIIICITPSHVRWWRNHAAMDEPAREWRAPPGTVYPVSDPAPAGKSSEAPRWPQPPWQDLAKSALARNVSGHLTLLDAEGHPLPIRAREVEAHREGFRLVIPKGAPWSQGKATLSFEGREVFVGNATNEDGATLLRVERSLPVLPLTQDYTEVLEPKPGTKAALMKRLEQELARRGQRIPSIPPDPPHPTAGAKLRRAGVAQWQRG